jgi:tetratricopeptide (TPR) repeat protein
MTKSNPAKEGHSDKNTPHLGDRPGQELTRRRRWAFRLLTILLIPAFFIGLLELALVVAGYGYQTDFFIKSRIGNQDYLIPNYQFSYRFFPKQLARKPFPFRIPAEKSDGVYRIFVFGESAALGDPDPSYGASRYLEILLEGRFPDADFEVVCVAMTAINSHVILPIAEEVAGLDGDLWVIYMGNNEMVGPFGAGTIFGARAPGIPFVRSNLALKKTRVGQLMAQLISKIGSSSGMPSHWTGIDMFALNLLRHDDAEKTGAYRNFERNLQDILGAGREAGVPVILSTVGSNLKDCSPFASLHRENLNSADLAEFERLMQDGRVLEKEKKYEDALNLYRRAIAIDSEYAELHFRIGSCRLALGLIEDARQSFTLARDYDGLAVRADSRINQIIMDAVKRDNGPVHRVDAAEMFSLHSEKGISGQEHFYEHVHLTVEGNYTLARMFAEQLEAMLPEEITDARNGSWPEHEECNRQLALTQWDRLRLWQEELKRLNLLPFSAQSSNPDNRKYIIGKMRGIKVLMNTDSWQQDKDNQMYVAALERAPEDTFLLENYSEFLNATGKTEEAIVQAEKFAVLLPDFAWTHCWLGALLMEAGRLEEARVSLENSLEVRSDFIPARELLKRIR